jgi:hypothetical protein
MKAVGLRHAPTQGCGRPWGGMDRSGDLRPAHTGRLRPLGSLLRLATPSGTDPQEHRCRTTLSDKLEFGWEEWVALPDLGLPAIKAKVDTGARTSALHASEIEVFGSNARPKVRFVVHPVANDYNVGSPVRPTSSTGAR